MLDLHKLHLFTTVIQEGSFSAAAQRLYITQSAVSQQIKELEVTLGRQLFQRGWRGVKLTPHGEILHQYAQEIFALIARAEAALTDVEQLTSGRICIGATPGIASYLIPTWVERFRSHYPTLTVTLNTGITSAIINDVLAQRLDIGLIEGELGAIQNPRLAWLGLAEIEQQVVVGMHHPWWGADCKPINALHRQSFIMRPPNSQTRIWLDEALRQYGIERIIGAEFDNLESIKRAVVSGTCMSILPRYTVEDEISQGVLHAIPLEGAPLKRMLKLIWANNIHFTPITRAFLQHVREDYPVLDQVLA
jgi:DNA-binding transcriptional LysR family regulator